MAEEIKKEAQTVEAQPKSQTFAKPIWKDYYIYPSASAGKYAEYEIYNLNKDGTAEAEPFYKGKAYGIPGKSWGQVNLSKILQPYLNSNYNPFDGWTYNKYCLPVGVIQNGGYMGYYVFYNSYSYDDPYFTDDKWNNIIQMNHPISNKVIRGSTVTFMCMNYSDTQHLDHIMSSYRDDKGDLVPVEGFESWTLEPWESLMIEIDTSTLPPDATEIWGPYKFHYDIVDECVDYIIYYQSPWGSIEQYPVRGTVKKSEVYTSHERNSSFNNGSLDFERDKYLVEYKRRYLCNLTNVPKNEAERLSEIASSNKIWLSDMTKGGEWTPVVCIDNDFDYKLENKSRNYQITFEDSQSRIRR